jgi:sugar/nucleoside kinase (ribokinase family)
MTTTTTARRDPAPPARSATVRVAPREIRDVAFRAMRVAGASGGEASLAARAVLAAQLHPSSPDGLAALLDELTRVRSTQVGARFAPGPVPVLQDPARRGLFFAVPAGVEHLLAHPDVSAVLLPTLRLRPAARALAAVTAGLRASELELLDPPGSPTAGILVRRIPPGLRPHAQEPPAPNDAETTGVLLDAGQWAAAQAAARAYLVPDS